MPSADLLLRHTGIVDLVVVGIRYVPHRLNVTSSK